MKDGWIVKKLGEVCKFSQGVQIPLEEQYTTCEKGMIRFLRIIDFTQKGETPRYIYNVDDKYILHDKEIAIVRYGTPGFVCYGKIGAIANNLFKILPKENLFDFAFLKYWLSSEAFQGVIKGSKYGVALQAIKFSTICEISVPIPPLSEQSRIVEELDKLSNIIEKKRQQLSELDNLAQSIFYDMFGDPVVNDKGWEVKKLGEVCKTTSGGTPSKSHSEYYEGGSIPWLRSGEVNNMYILNAELCITEEGLANSSAKWFPQNTVVIAMYGATVGQVGILCRMMTTNQAICGIFPNESFAPIYLYHFLLSKKEEYIKLASGGAQPNISQNIIRDTLVCCPDITLQQLFAKKIEAIESEKALIKQSIAETEELFNSRMDYYFG